MISSTRQSREDKRGLQLKGSWEGSRRGNSFKGTVHITNRRQIVIV